MRKRLAEGLIALLVLIAGIGIVGALTRPESTQTGDDSVSIEEVTTTSIDPAYVQAVRDAEFRFYTDAVYAHQIGVFTAAINDHKAERARQQAATAARAPVPQRYVEQPASVPSGSVWDRLAVCEAGGNWAHPPVGPMAGNPSSYSGGLMFDYKTWNAYGGQRFAPAAWQASREQQIVIAEAILADVGWGAWPACSSKLGLR